MPQIMAKGVRRVNMSSAGIFCEIQSYLLHCRQADVIKTQYLEWSIIKKKNPIAVKLFSYVNLSDVNLLTCTYTDNKWRCYNPQHNFSAHKKFNA